MKMRKQNCLIYCNCGAGIISDEKQQKLGEAFKSLDIDVFELHDICAFSVNEPGFLNALEKNYETKYVVACYPRAIKNIFQQNKIALTNYEVLNFREMPVDKIVGTLKEKTGVENPARYAVKKSDLDVPAWYPVIEQSRCTLCGQCARFCLFGVYEFSKKKSLKVVNPLACKNNCPACGRTCPAQAIIFPRLPENSVLSGAEPGEGKPAVQPAKKDGLFVMLNERNNSRRNILRQGLMAQAEEERKKAIEELKLGIKKK